MANKPYLDQIEVDGTTYDLRAANGTPVIEGYGGNDLSEEFESAAAFHAAVAAGDFSKIRVGDFFPITVSGSYRDYARFTVPAGTTYYTDAALSTEGGTTSEAVQGEYQSATAVKFTLSGSDCFAAIGDCQAGFMKTMNETVKMEVAAINPYLRMGDTELTAQHILLVSRDCLANTIQMRCNNGVWYDTSQVNPWLGSAAYQTLNNPDDGIVKLVEATSLGAYMFAGPQGKGMRAMLPSMAAGSASPTTWAWNNRGKLFLPTEREVYGAPVWGNGTYETGNLYNQWPIFAGSARHIMKGSGNGGGRCAWWLETATTASYFAFVGNYGFAGYGSAVGAFRVPLCFLFT